MLVCGLQECKNQPDEPLVIARPSIYEQSPPLGSLPILLDPLDERGSRTLSKFTAYAVIRHHHLDVDTWIPFRILKAKVFLRRNVLGDPVFANKRKANGQGTSAILGPDPCLKPMVLVGGGLEYPEIRAWPALSHLGWEFGLHDSASLTCCDVSAAQPSRWENGVKAHISWLPMEARYGRAKSKAARTNLSSPNELSASLT
jgi:hypothetical protein